MQLSVLDQGSISSFADIVSQSNYTTVEGLQEIERRIAAEGLPIEAVMGFRDDLRALTDWINGRQLVDELPETIHPVTWLEFHVPKHGTGALSSTLSSEDEGAFEISVFGSGLGAGRKLSLLFEDSSDRRHDCARYVIFLRVVPKVYRTHDQESVVLDVIGAAGEAVEAISPCPHCGILPSEIDKFDFYQEQFLDLRRESVPRKRMFEVKESSDSSARVGIDFPSVKAPLSLILKLRTTRSWKVEYEFAPGLLYQPYRRLGATFPHTPMWAVEGHL